MSGQLSKVNTFHWGYHGFSGPSYWVHDYMDCAGSMQSPIDIPREEEVEYAENLGYIEFYGYDDVRVHSVRNNGHSLQVDVSGDSYIAGVGLEGLYKVSQLHFHWGVTSDSGSEHTIHGKAFPMETKICKVYNFMSRFWNECRFISYSHV
ncbi:hypothetical protein ACJMK2_011532 [Sinanodonta woodiana]|uniref:carbonic anhydrase n=1 Tax=Sinanodonta woodiana TaxID=1069815 RepID=A0ABD3V5A8_SINWO